MLTGIVLLNKQRVIQSDSGKTAATRAVLLFYLIRTKACSRELVCTARELHHFNFNQFSSRATNLIKQTLTNFKASFIVILTSYQEVVSLLIIWRNLVYSEILLHKPFIKIN